MRTNARESDILCHFNSTKIGNLGSDVKTIAGRPKRCYDNRFCFKCLASLQRSVCPCQYGMQDAYYTKGFLLAVTQEFHGGVNAKKFQRVFAD